MWPTMLTYIPNSAKLHCLALDLPAHGESSYNEDVDEATVDSLAHSVKEFLDVMNLDKVHLIGYRKKLRHSLHPY